MRLDHFIYGTILFSLIVVGGTLMFEDMINTYDINETTDRFDDVYNITGDLYDISQDMKNDTISGEVEGADQSWESLVKGAYSAITLVTGSFNLIGKIVDDVAEEIGVPPLFRKVAMTILLVAIIFAIIYLVFRFKN